MPPRPRHALITGGSRGIGLAIAQTFAKNSIRCTLVSRSSNDLKSAVATLQPLPGYADFTHNITHGFIAGNISSTGGSTMWNKAFKDRLPRPRDNPDSSGRIDILVNCAGVSQMGSFLGTGVEEIEKVVTTNLTSLIIGTKFLMRKGYLQGLGKGKLQTSTSEEEASPMADAEREAASLEAKEDSTPAQEYPSPVIINISSLLALKSGFGATSYAASKAGILGFTRALATEYSIHGVRVNAIVPGYIKTDMTSSLNEEDLTKQIPLGRFGTPEEIAQAAFFLAQNEYAHNCVLNLDGGLSAM